MDRVTSSNTDIVSPTPGSSISTSNYSGTTQVRRRRGRPCLRGGPSVLNDITNAPTRRVTSSHTDILSPTRDSFISTSSYSEAPQVRRRRGRPRLRGRPTTLNDDITNSLRCRVTSSHTVIVSPTPDSSISPSNYSESPWVRRRPSPLNDDITNAPRRRPGMPSSLVASSSGGPYVGRTFEHEPQTMKKLQ